MQRTKYIILLLLVINGFSAMPQKYLLKATVKGMPADKVYFLNYYGDKNTLLDSATVDSSGFFQIILKESYRMGLYKLNLGKSLKSQFYGGDATFINIILNKENIEFSTNFASPVDSMKIISSAENKTFYDFLKSDTRVNSQLDVLSQLPAYFPKTDEFYPAIEKRFNTIQKENQNNIASLLKKNRGSYAARLIKSKHFPALQFALSGGEKQKYIRQHFFDNVDFTDTLLLYSDVFTAKAIDYILLFRRQDISKEQQESEFIKAVDTLMLKSRGNETVTKQIREYIIRGFELLDMNKVLAYIVEKHSPETACEDDRHEQNLKKRIEGYKKLTMGSKAPDINFTDFNNKEYKLSESKTAYTFLIFWASWCPHCMQTLPELKKLYDAQTDKKFEVVAISIDTSKTAFSDAIKNNGFNWINYSDYKGWNGTVTGDYYIYATPTMFLLDKAGKIILKPTSITEMESFIKM